MSVEVPRMSSQIELIFLGTGTSAGVPMIGCHCDVCSSSDPRDNRTRCSVVINYDGHSILVDTSPELRLQCVAQKIDRIDAVVFTHAHADHIMGLDDIRRFNTIKAGPLDVYADERTHEVLQSCFAYAFKEPKPEWKLFRPHLHPRTIHGPFDLLGKTWQPIRMTHGEGSVLGFRIDNLAYCTDTSHISPTAMEHLCDLDVLVLDALQVKKHPTHLTIEEALSVVAELKPKRTWFTHMSHQVMHAIVDATLPAGVRLAYDGLRVVSLK